jgi:iron complex outermembrane receptor protein
MEIPEFKMYAVVCAAVAQLLAGQVLAQARPEPGRNEETQLEEVVVTAERRESDVQKTATSVSVRSGSELRDEGRYTLGQILEDVPGVTGGAASAPTPGGSGVDTSAPGLTIRGIPSNAGAIGNVTSAAAAAAVYVDGVYEGVGGDYDIDRVEILRGPQGTLYGRSATSGLVAIHTADPDLTSLGGNAAVELGNYGLQHYSGAVSVPLVSDVLAIRIAGNRYERDGYFSSDGDGAITTNDAKIKLLYQPNADVSLLLGYALQNNDTPNGGVTITLNTPYTFNFTPTPIGSGSNKFRQYWGDFEWNLGFAKLTYEPAYRTWESSAATFARGQPPPQPFEDINTNIDVPRDHFNTQELRLASNPASKLIWQTGVLYYDNSLSSHLVVQLVDLGIDPINALVRDKTTTAIGGFAEATYPVTDAWRVTGGARYDHTKVSVDEDYTSITGMTQTLSGSAGTRTFSNFTYKARVEHDLTTQNLLYASISTGFSPGDISVSTSPAGNPFALELQAETLTAYEIGSKNRFLDQRLQVNGAVYYYDYGAYQAANVNISNIPGVLTFSTLAAPARSYGAELETIVQMTPDDRASVNLAYTNATFTDKNRPIDTGLGGFVTFGQYFTRDEIPNVTPFVANFGYDHIFRLPGDSTLTLHGDARFMAAHYLINVAESDVIAGRSPYLRLRGEWLGDVGATWALANSRFSVTGYGRNIANNQYKTTAFVQDPNILSAPHDPRTYGVVLATHF